MEPIWIRAQWWLLGRNHSADNHTDDRNTDDRELSHYEIKVQAPNGGMSSPKRLFNDFESDFPMRVDEPLGKDGMEYTAELEGWPSGVYYLEAKATNGSVLGYEWKFKHDGDDGAPNYPSKQKNYSRKLARDLFWNEHDKTVYRCPDCARGESEIAGSFEVHHKNGEPFDNRPENHVGLCGLCHKLREDKKPSLREIRNLRDGKKTTIIEQYELEQF